MTATGSLPRRNKIGFPVRFRRAITLLKDCRNSSALIDCMLHTIDTLHDSCQGGVQGRSVRSRKRARWQRQNVKLTPVVPRIVSLAEALEYVWSLPVSVLISGMENASQVQENAAIARKAATLDDQTRSKLVAAVETFSGRDVEFYKD